MPQYPKCLEVGKPLFCYFEIDGRCLYAGNCEYREGSENLRRELAKKRTAPVKPIAATVKIPGQIRTL